jgi:uncharacterized protein DUF4231
MEQHEVLEQELNCAIKRLHEDSQKHKRLHRRLRYATFGLAALSTILASAGAFSEHYRESLLMAVVVTTAVAGLVTSVEGTRKPGELWVHERRTYYELVDLRRELLFIASRATDAELTQLFNRLHAILSVSAASWAKLKPGDDSGDAPAKSNGPQRLDVKRSEWVLADHRAP